MVTQPLGRSANAAPCTRAYFSRETRRLAVDSALEDGLQGARLPREASPAKIAKDGQHNNDHDDDPKPGRPVVLPLGTCRFCGEPSGGCNVRIGRRKEKAHRGDTAAIIPFHRWEEDILWPFSHVGSGTPRRGR